MSARFTHTLIVGGTGMLRSATLALAEQSRALTSIARTEASLRAVDERLVHAECTHRTHAVDYRDAGAFGAALSASVEEAGAVDLAVAWIHDDAPASTLIGFLGERPPCRIFHVLGSAAGDPTATPAAASGRPHVSDQISYHRVILGFVRDGSRSRWLSDEEISSGVLAAVEAGEDEYVVGTVRPWSARP